MVKVNGKVVSNSYFPDGTLLFDNCKYELDICKEYHFIEWYFENNEELVKLYFITRHLQQGDGEVHLFMPYIPNARFDRVEEELNEIFTNEIFTLKHFSEIINSLNFKSVQVFDPHSSVSKALFNNLRVRAPEDKIELVINNLKADLTKLLMFYPDEGAMKRYSKLIKRPYAFGVKDRDWKTSEIKGLQVLGEVQNGAPVLIVDDICSKGGTFYYSAKQLKELGAGDIYLYVTHCENTILEGELIKSGLIKRIYTTDSIFTKEHKDIEVISIRGGQ